MIEQQQEQLNTQDTEITLGMGKLLAIFFIFGILFGGNLRWSIHVSRSSCLFDDYLQAYTVA